MSALQALPKIDDITAFNLARWKDLCADPFWGKMQGRLETDRFGNVIMTPPADPEHGGRQADFVGLFIRLMTGGKAYVECPVSTPEGIKVADVAWVSAERLKTIKHRSALKAAPEICVEVLSPSNTRDEIQEKKRLYFEAGALEVWICSRAGEVSFYLCDKPAKAAKRSKLCPLMPAQLPEE